MGTFNSSLWGGGSPAQSGVFVSGRDLIYDALRLLGVLRPGQVASDSSYTDGLRALNRMVDGWNSERLALYATARHAFTITASLAAHTFGPGGNLDITARPVRLDRAGLVVSGTEHPVEILSPERWATETDRSATGQPDRLFCDFAFPLANVYLLPVPSAADTLALYFPQHLEGFTDLDTQYSFPPGYTEALLFGLASALSPSFKIIAKIPDRDIAYILGRANETKAKIKSINVPPIELTLDPALADYRRYDIVSDRFR